MALKLVLLGVHSIGLLLHALLAAAFQQRLQIRQRLWSRKDEKVGDGTKQRLRHFLPKQYFALIVFDTKVLHRRTRLRVDEGAAVTPGRA